MICGRFTLIIISSTLTFNLVDHICWATESSAQEISMPQPSSTRVIANQAEIYSNQMTSNLDQTIKLENFALDSQTISSTPSNSSLDTDEAATEINKLWLVAAMVVTSGLSLFLLRILFQRPVSKPETSKGLTAVSESNKLPEMKIKAAPAVSMAVAVPSPSPRLQANNLRQPNQVKETETPHHLHQDDSVLPSSVPWVPQGLSDEVSSSVYIPRHLSPGNGLRFMADLGFVNTKHQAQPHTEQLPASDTIIAINSGENYIDVVAELTQDLKQSERNIRRKAIWELAKLGDSRVIEPLMAIMPQASPVDKSLIIKAIKQITQRSVKPVNERLLQLLNDQNPQVRVNAILDLANFYQFVVPVTQRLEKMQFDEDPEVRLTAIRALNNLTQGYSVARLQDYADHQVGGMKVQDNDSAN